MGTTSILSVMILGSSVFSAAFLRNAFEARKDRNYREMAGALAVSFLALGMACITWTTTGDSSVTVQNWLLGTVGAAIGASIFIYGGYVVRDKWSAHAQTAPQPAAQQPLSVGDESVVTGNVKGAVGNKSVVVAPMDNESTNTIVNPPPGGLAVGAGAKAGPNSVSIGAGAGAGTRTP